MDFSNDDIVEDDLAFYQEFLAGLNDDGVDPLKGLSDSDEEYCYVEDIANHLYSEADYMYNATIPRGELQDLIKENEVGNCKVKTRSRSKRGGGVGLGSRPRRYDRRPFTYHHPDDENHSYATNNSQNISRYRYGRKNGSMQHSIHQDGAFTGGSTGTAPMTFFPVGDNHSVSSDPKSVNLAGYVGNNLTDIIRMAGSLTSNLADSGSTTFKNIVFPFSKTQIEELIKQLDLYLQILIQFILLLEDQSMKFEAYSMLYDIIFKRNRAISEHKLPLFEISWFQIGTFHLVVPLQISIFQAPLLEFSDLFTRLLEKKLSYSHVHTLMKQFRPFILEELLPFDNEAARKLNTWKHRKFSDTEDALFLVALKAYGHKNMDAVRQNWLVDKSIQEIKHRYKNLICSRAPETPIKKWKLHQSQSLTNEEISLIIKGCKWFGLDNFKLIYRYFTNTRPLHLLKEQFDKYIKKVPNLSQNLVDNDARFSQDLKTSPLYEVDMNFINFLLASKDAKPSSSDHVIIATTTALTPKTQSQSLLNLSTPQGLTLNSFYDPTSIEKSRDNPKVRENQSSTNFQAFRDESCAFSNFQFPIRTDNNHQSTKLVTNPTENLAKNISGEKWSRMTVK